MSSGPLVEVIRSRNKERKDLWIKKVLSVQAKQSAVMLKQPVVLLEHQPYHYPNHNAVITNIYIGSKCGKCFI